MPHIILPDRRLHAPRFSLRLNRSNPLTRGLIVAWVPMSPHRELASNLPVNSVIAKADYAPRGYEWDRSNAYTDEVLLGVRDATSYEAGGVGWAFYNRPAYSTFALVTPGVLTNRQTPFAVGIGNSISMGYSDPSAIFFHPGGGGYVSEVGAGTFVSGQRACIGAVFDYARSSTSDSRFYKNGNLVTIADSSGSSTASISDYYVARLGSGDGSNTTNWRGKLHCVLAWNIGLDEASARAISANPWQIFKRDTARTYFFPSASTSSFKAWLKVPARWNRQPPP